VLYYYYYEDTEEIMMMIKKYDIRQDGDGGENGKG
jgi:hypothetical protein